MIKFLTLIFVSLSSFCFSQSILEDSDLLWSKGDILIGVNSELTENSWTDITISPSIGYAFTDNDLIYGNFRHVDSPSRSSYKVGYNRQLCNLGYVGMGLSVSKYQSEDWAKYFCLEAGIGKTIGGWLLVTPKVTFEHLWDNEITQYTVNTSITFSLKL